jgi:ABC-type multidrug transport system fused ATPase/permease subunit
MSKNLSRSESPTSIRSFKNVNFVFGGSCSHSYNKLFDQSVDVKEERDNGVVDFNDEKEDRVYQPDAEPFCLVWKDLSVLLKKKGTKLIDGVSGVARSGRVLALMGPSGAGKMIGIGLGLRMLMNTLLVIMTTTMLMVLMTTIIMICFPNS